MDEAIQIPGPLYTLEHAAIDVEAKSGNAVAAVKRPDKMIANANHPESLLVTETFVLAGKGDIEEFRVSYVAV